MNATIKASIEQAIATLLTPRRNIDILKEALAAKKQGRVYSIAFIGVSVAACECRWRRLADTATEEQELATEWRSLLTSLVASGVEGGIASL